MSNSLKRFLSLTMALIMVIGMMPTNIVFATEGEDTTTSPETQATTTPADETAIESQNEGEVDITDNSIDSVAELQAFAAAVNGGNAYAGVTVTLNANLDLTGAAWTPIGNAPRAGKSYTGYAFKGIFDGGNHTISGLTIANENAGDATLGLFGVVDGGTVKNLKLANVSISGNGDNVGAAVAILAGNGTVSGVSVSGSVAGADGVGGVVGRILVAGTVENCTNAAAVSADSTCGGVVGKAYYTETGKTMTIKDCINTGSVTGAYAGGGISGHSAADVSGCSNSGTITGTDIAGGIIGQQYCCGTVSGNTNTGTVSSSQNAGGIIGWIRYESSDNYEVVSTIAVSDNNNSGNVSGDVAAGGIVGDIYEEATVSGNENTAASITASANGKAAGIVASVWQSDAAAEKVISFSGNTSTTAEANLTGGTTAEIVNGTDNVNTVIAVAKTGGTTYATLTEAVEKAEDGAIVTLLSDVTGAGIIIKKNLTIDFGGHTYTVNGPAVGSTGTETLAFQIKAGSNAVPYDVTLKNGTIAVVEVPVEGSNELKVVVMNYSNLTVEDLTIDGTGNTEMECALANNNGTTQLIGNTNIVVNEGVTAIDVDGSQDYYGAVNVTVNTTGTITGRLDFYGEEGNVALQAGTFVGEIYDYGGTYGTAVVAVSGGSYTTDVTAYLAEGYELTTSTDAEGNTIYGVGEISPVAKIGDEEYDTLQAAFDTAATMTGPVYVVLQDDLELSETVQPKGTANSYAAVLDLNGHSITSSASPVIDNAEEYFFGIIDTNETDRGSIVCTVEGGTVIQNSGMFTELNSSGVVIGNDTGYAVKSTGDLCQLSTATYLGDLEITGSFAKPIGGGKYSVDLTDEKYAGYYDASKYTVAKGEDGTYGIGILPNAEVVDMGITEITDYDIYNGSGLVDGTDPITLQVAMEFLAKDTAEEAEANAFGHYTTDFYITMTGAADGESITMDEDCYLAGNYDPFGWIMIPLRGMEIVEGKIYPVITSVGLDFSYADICTSVKDFKCGIHLSEAVLAANPGLEVTLSLALSEEPLDAVNNDISTADFITVDEPYTYDVDDMMGYVAEVGGVKYTSVQAAVNAAEAGATVTLLNDVTLGAGENIKILEGTGVTITGNGYTISGEDGFWVEGGKLTLNDDLTVEVSVYNAIYIRSGEVITSANLIATGEYAVIQGNGNYAGKVTILGGDITSENGTAIYWPQDGELSIEGGTITGTTAVYAKSGGVYISGGTLVATGEKADYIHNSSGMYSTGDALVIESCDYPGGAPEVSITGGTFTSANGSAVASYATNDQEVVTGFISGGTYSSDVGEYLAYGYELNEDDNGNFVAEQSYVAQVGGTKYKSLQRAINSAANGATVKLLTTVEAITPVVIPAGKTLTLNLNGNSIIRNVNETLTANDALLRISKGADLTITDVSDNSGGLVYGYYGEATGWSGYSASTIENNQGTLTINGGQFYNAANMSEQIAYTINSLTNNENGDAAVTVNGGAIMAEGGTAIRQFANSTTCENTLVINDGYIVGRVQLQSSNAKANKASLTINGGAIVREEDKTAVEVWFAGGASSAYENISASITGGDITGNIVFDEAPEGYDSKIITGGTFYTDAVEAYLADGYVLEAYDNGSYGVNKIVVAVIGEETYSTLEAAIAAAEDGDIIELVADVAASQIITIDKNITLSGNHNTLTSSASRAINIGAENVDSVAVKIENLNIAGEAGCERGINIIESAAAVELNNVSVHDVRDYAVHVANSAQAVELAINGGEYTSYGALCLNSDDGDAITATVNEARLVGVNTYDNAESNNFSTIAVDGKNITVTVTEGEVVAAAEGQAPQAIVGAETENKVTVTLDTVLTTENATILGFTKAASPVGEGSNVAVRADYAQQLADEGYACEAVEGTGLISVTGAAAAAVLTDSGPVTYTTLADAIAAAENGQDILLLADIELDERVSIAKDESVRIDLNGHTITSNVASGTQAFYVRADAENRGDLTISDSSEEQTGAIIKTNGGTVIGNYGVVTINGGKIESGADRGYDAALYNYCYEGTLFGIATVYGGELDTVWNCGELTIREEEGKTTNISYIDTSALTVIEAGTVDTLIVKEANYTVANESRTAIEDAATVNSYTAAAKSDNSYYASLEDAVDAMQGGGEITLLTDVTLDEMLIISAAGLTLDLNGKTIDTDFTVASGNDCAICVAYGADLTITDSVGGGTIDGSGVYGAVKMTYTGDNVENGPARLTVDGGELIGNYYAVVGNGSRSGTEITINDGTLTATQEVWGYGIFHPQNGILDINGGVIKAATGIEMRAGELNVYGGEITSNAAELTTGTSGSGTTVSGAAIAVSQHNTDYPINVNVYGGSLSGPYAFYQDRLIPTYRPSTDEISAHIGTEVELNGAVDAAEVGFNIPQADDGSYSLEKVDVVASVTDADGNVTYFETLVEAFDAANGGDTIDLLCDTDITEQIKVTDQAVLNDITVNGNGHAISADLNKDNQSVLYFGDPSTSKWAIGVTINDLTIRGTARFGIALMGGTSSVLNSVTVEGDYVYGINLYGTHGAEMNNCNISSMFTNAQNDYPLVLNSTWIGELYANKSDDPSDAGKITVGDDSTVDSLFVWGDNTSMVASGLDNIGWIEAFVDEGTVPMVAEVDGIRYTTVAGALEVADEVTLIGYADEAVALTEGQTIIKNGHGVSEVTVAEAISATHTIVETEETYTVTRKPSVATIGDVGYATLEAAIAAANAGDEIVVVAGITTDDTIVVDEDVTINLNGNIISAGALENAPVMRILANVTVTNGTVDGTSGINSYAFIVGNSTTEGTLNIADGIYMGITSAVSITKGVANISGGEFSTAHDNEGTNYGTWYLLNAIDGSDSTFNITGGTFMGFNPADNTVEGADTNLLDAANYHAIGKNNAWTVSEHSEEVIPAVDATCSATGLTEGTKCSDCDAVLVEQEVTDKIAHTEEVIPAVAATFDATGLTEGKKCSVCGETLVAQEVVAKKIAVAEVNGNKYETLIAAQDAVKSVGNGTITLLNDVTTTAYLGITGAGVDYTLDLNGHTITTDGTHDVFKFSTGGPSLTIKDSVGSGQIIATDSGACIFDIFGNATVTVEGGTLNATRSVAYVERGTINVTGGTLTAQKVIETHTGGTNDHMKISGGTFNGAIATDLTGFITGGTFNFEPEAAHIADGYSAAKTSSGMWTIVEGQTTTDGEAAIGSTVYATLAEAIEAANEMDGAFINLLADVTTAPDVKITNTMTIIPNGHKLWNDNSVTALSEICEGCTASQNFGILFVTKDTGSSAVVAKIGDTGYSTVKSALEAAKSGDTVVMVADSNEPNNDLIINEGITLYLGAYDLTARSITGANGAFLYGDTYHTTKDYATLKVGTFVLGETAPEIGGYKTIPVFDPSQSCYVFSKYNIVTNLEKTGLKINEEEKQIYFQFTQSLTGSVKSDLLANDYTSVDNRFKVMIRLTWESDNGTYKQDYVYKDEFVREVSKVADNSTHYTFTLNGYDMLNLTEENMDTLAVQAMILTDSGVVSCSEIFDMNDDKLQ